MRSGSAESSPLLSGGGTELLSQAISIVAREAARLAGAIPAGSAGPIAGAHAVDDASVRVPLLGCLAPVQAGEVARATVRVANDESEPAEVSLYCSNFVGDSGYEIPSLRVTSLPRAMTIPAGGEGSFDVRIAVSQQTPAGTYSGLIQAMGSRYVKAVLSVDVR
jgi:hypothetical protein